MVNRQFDVLTWLYENQEALPLESGKIWEAYTELRDADIAQSTFSQTISKLKEKGVVDKPTFREYDINERGIQRVENLKGLDTDKYRRPDNYKDVVDELKAFLLEEKDDEIHEAAAKGETWKVSLDEIDRFNSDMVYDFMMDNFQEFSDAFDEALSETVMNEEAPKWQFESDLQYLETDLIDVKSSDKIGKPVVVEAMIRQAEELMPVIVSATFECTQCGDRYTKEQDSSQLKSPYKCDCGSKRFEPIDKEMIDSIVFELSQRDEKETTINCVLEGASPEDASKLLTGRKVKVLGVTRERPLNKDSRKFDVYLEAHSYELTERTSKPSDFTEEEKQQVMEKIEASDNSFRDFWSSIAPNIADRDLPKKCIAVSLMGAPELNHLDSEYGRLHMGIISNPGMGKSNVLKWVRDSFNKFYMADGGNATGTALTGASEQNESGRWIVIAGKAVYAHKGRLHIDEFDKFNKGELSKLNTALEEGFIPVDKGTAKAELPARLTAFFTGNFSRKLDKHTPAYELLPEKAPGLYDRIPLLCAVTENSSKVTKAVIDNHANNSHSFNVEPYFSAEELRIYRDMAQEHCPEVTPEAQKYIQNFYEGGTGHAEAEIQGKSMRPLVNLMKITKALARFDLSDNATREHAAEACKIMREARESIGLDMGEKPTGKLIESQRLKHFDEVYKNITSGSNEKVDITKLEKKYLSEFDHDRSVFDEVLEKKKREGEYFEPENGVIMVTS